MRTLRKYLNVHAVLQVLLVAWISYVLAHPKIPSTNYLILLLVGGQGSGKSFLCNLLLRLIDPSKTGVQVLPRNVKDLAISMQSSQLRCIDNTRTVSSNMSDYLCMTSTGGTLNTRRLYTDDEEQSLNLHGALVINGIGNIVEQPDLHQRCLTIELKPIQENQRKSETELLREFEADLPVIMRELFELIANIFKHLPEAEVAHPERMLDFCRWLAAMERVDGHPASCAYQSNYSDVLNAGQLDSLQSNLLASAVLDFAETLKSAGWVGTPADLLEDLNDTVGRNTQRSRDWPQNPIALSKRLLPLQAGLLTQGVSVKFTRGKRRTIAITVTGGQNES
jgi:energy-coupling factor transporter ATP-binding protein EcfA2